MSKFYENEKTIIAALILLGISEVFVEFDGSGDSGSISNITFFKDGKYFPEKEITSEILVYQKGQTVFDSKEQKWVREQDGLQTRSLVDALKDHVYEALDDTGVDWYNNDGGFGSWVWNAADGINFEVNQRAVLHDLVYSAQRQVGKAVDEYYED